MQSRLILSNFMGGLAAAALWLAACAPAATPAPSATPVVATPSPAPSATPLPTATARPADTPAATPTVTATTTALFPPVTSDDWQLGPTDARFTFIEYGDYQ